MVYRLIQLLILFGCLSAQAEVTWFCHSSGQISTLFITDKDGTHEMADIKFTPPLHIDSITACARFLEKIPKKLRAKVSASTLIGGEHWANGRFVGEGLSEVYGRCLSDEYCQVRWPYILSKPNLIWDQLSKIGKGTNNRCEQVEVIKRVSALLPKKLELTALDKAAMKWWSMPDTNIVEMTINELKQKKFKEIWIAAMTVSAESLKELAAIAQKTETKIHIFTDLQLQSHKTDFIRNAKALSQSVSFSFIPRTKDRPFSFHFKGVLMFGSQTGNKDQLLWISPNWHKTQQELIFHDWGFTSHEESLVISMRNELRHYKKEICSNEKIWNDCFVDVRFSKKKLRNDWEMLMAQACTQETLRPNHGTETSKVFFHRKYEIKPTFKEWILQTKRSLVLRSHVLRNSEVIDWLATLQKKGVTIRLFAGKKMDDGEVRKIRQKGIELHTWDKVTEEFHMKYVIRDGEEMLLSSANLTDTGLSNTTELSFLIKDPVFIQAQLARLSQLQKRASLK